MTALRCHSFNVANRVAKALPLLRDIMERSDISYLRYEFREYIMHVNCDPKHKNRSVALILNPRLAFKSVWRSPEGNMIGAVLVLGNLEFLAVSVYMPPNLDVYGCPAGALDANQNLSGVQQVQLLAN